MEDQYIVDLFWARSEDAISETEAKYWSYLLKIADNILFDLEDSREAVNDTYYRAWCTMPDKRPEKLNLYLAKIARDLSIDIWRARRRKKRAGSEYALSLEELEEAVPAAESTEDTVEEKLMMEEINVFLRSLPVLERQVFIGRYFYADPAKMIGSYLGISESKVKNLLHKVRKNLKAYLEKEGYSL